MSACRSHRPQGLIPACHILSVQALIWLKSAGRDLNPQITASKAASYSNSRTSRYLPFFATAMCAGTYIRETAGIEPANDLLGRTHGDGLPYHLATSLSVCSDSANLHRWDLYSSRVFGAACHRKPFRCTQHLRCVPRLCPVTTKHPGDFHRSVFSLGYHSFEKYQASSGCPLYVVAPVLDKSG